MGKCDILVIGAGVIGLAVAERLSAARQGEIVVVEQHAGFGYETSSRNSEVIHAGFYYPSGSLKATLCLRGKHMLYEQLEKEGIPYRRCGKMVIGNTPAEIAKVHSLYVQGNANGVEDLTLLSHQQIQKMEPSVFGTVGLFSPTTGIFDTHRFMASLERQSLERGVVIAYNCRVIGILSTTQGYQVEIADADGIPLKILAETVVNAAGLGADTIATMAGIDIDQAGYRQHPCKGEYFGISTRHYPKLSGLIYPAPTPLGLGIHTVLGLDGSLRLGPNAFYVDTIDYDVDPGHHQEFFQSARSYLPFLDYEDITPDMAGIRSKLQPPGNSGFFDFLIREESNRGLSGFINLIGIESPGLTSSLAIAEYVQGLL